MLWKLPPKAKVYEALSAVADGRVRLLSDHEAEVSSSAGDKLYKVRWEDGRVTSSDPASRFQGYLGYPALAVLLQIGRLHYDPELAAHLHGIPWKKLNDQFKRNYDAAVDHALAECPEPQQIRAMADRIYAELESLGLSRYT